MRKIKFFLIIKIKICYFLLQKFLKKLTELSLDKQQSKRNKKRMIYELSRRGWRNKLRLFF